MGGLWNWSDSVNWGSNTAPTLPGLLTFAGTSGLLSNNNLSAQTVNGFTFSSGAGAFTLSGNSITLGGDITNSGTSLQTINLAMATTAVRNVTTAASGGDITLGGALSGLGGGITKVGSGTLTLSGNIIYTGVTSVSAGTLTLSGTSTYINNTLVNNGILNVSGTINSPLTTLTIGEVSAGNKAVVNVTGSVTEFQMYSGTSGASGALNLKAGGIINIVGGDSENSFTMGANNNAYGYFNNSGGTLNTSRITFGNQSGQSNGTGVGLMSAGTINNSTFLILSRANGSIGEFTITGGILNRSVGTAGQTLGLGWDGTGGRAELNVLGGLINNSGAGGVVTYGNNAGTVTGILNLNGGALRTNSFTKVATATAYLNFAGGTLQASSSTTTFLPALTGVYVNGAFGTFAGGAVIDTNGFNDTIVAPLLAPTGSGLATLPMTTMGSGYIGAPHVTITGTGTGATAIANMIDDGAGALKVGSITITNPGVGYTGTPTFALSGGAPGTAGTVGTATLAANTSGGLTKSGIGTLILSGSNTYTGATIISGGTLQLGNGSAGTLAATALTFNGGTFNYQGVTAGSTQTLGVLTFGTAEGTVQATYGTSGTTTLGFASLAARTAGATGNFVTAGGTNGTTNLIKFTTGPTAGALIDRGLFFSGSSYASYASGGFVRAYGSGDTNYVAAAGGTSTIVSGSTANVVMTGSVTSQGAATINTLNLGANSLGLGAVAFQTDGILQSGGATSTISGGTSLSTATASGELVVRSNLSTDTLAISTPIVDNTGATALTLGGAGTLTLSGANTYTGTTTLNGGILALGGSSALGSTGNIVFSGGSLQFSASNTTDYSSRINSGTSAGTVLLDTNGQNVTFATGLSSTKSGGLTKAGTGTLTLSATNAYTGLTTIPAGTLSLTGSLTGGGAVSTAGSAILNESSAGVINGGASVTLASTGTSILAGVNPYTGATTISAGTLSLTGSLTGGGAISTAGSAILNESSTGVISGASAVTQGSSGTSILAGANTYTGTTTISSGTLKLGNSSALPSGNTLAVSGTLDLAGFNAATTFLSGGGVITNSTTSDSTFTLNLDANVAAAYGGTITTPTTGKVNFVFNATAGGLSSNFSLNSPGTFKGAITVNGTGSTSGNTGVLGVGNNTALGDVTNVITLNNGGGLSSLFNPVSSSAWASHNSGIVVANPIVLSGAAGGVIRQGFSDLLTLSGGISGSALTKTDSGSVTLSGANTYTGGTTLAGGTLTLGSSAAIGSTGSIVFSGGTLQYSSSNTTDYSARIDSGTSASAVSIDTNGQNVTFTNALSATKSGGLTKAGTGTLTLSGTNLYTGQTTVSAGTLKNGSATVFTGKGAIVLTGTATFDLGGNNASFINGQASAATSFITNSGTADATLSLNSAGTLSGLVTDGPTNKTMLSLVNADTGVALLTNNANTFSGGIKLLNGTSGGTRLYIVTPVVTVGSAGAIISSTYGTGAITLGTVATDNANILLGGTMPNTLPNAIVFNTALGDSTGYIGIRVDGGTKTLSGAITANSNAAFSGIDGATVSGAISGAGGLVKGGTSGDIGILVLSGVNTYQGATSIAFGGLTFGKTSSMPSTTAVTVASTGTLGAFAGGSGGFTSGGSAVNGTVEGLLAGLGGQAGSTVTWSAGSSLALDTTNASGGSYTYSPVLANTGAGVLGFGKQGGGTLVVSGANSYTGATIISSGILQLGSAGSGANTPLGTVAAGTTVSNGGSLDLGGFSLATAEALTLTGTGVQNGSSYLGGGALTNNSATAATYSGLITLAASSTGGSSSSIVANNGNIILSNTGTITASAALFFILDGTATGSSIASTIGTGASVVNKTGSGTWTLGGANTYTGGTNIKGGILGLTGSLAANPIATTGSGVLNESSTGVISGAATLTLSGTGTNTLLGGNTYTGLTTIQGGILQLGNGASGTLAATALTFYGGKFNCQGVTAGGTQTLGALTFSAGEGTVQSTYGTSGTTTLAFASLTARPGGAIGNFVTSGGSNGSSNLIKFTAGPTAGALIDRGLFFNGGSYAAYAAGGFVRAYGVGDTFYAAAAGGSSTIVNGATTNVALGGSVTTQAAAAVNTLNLGASSLGLNTGVAFQTNGILQSGGASTISGGTSLSSATSGGELVIRTNGATDTLVISTPIMTNGATALTLGGAGTLTLSGGIGVTGTVNQAGTGITILSGTNTYSGMTNVSGSGTLRFTGSSTGTLAAINVYGNGQLNIETGSYTEGAGGIVVGQYTPTAGTINQSGGTVSFNSNSLELLLGNNAGSTGTYSLSGGSLSTAAAAATTTRGIILGTNPSSTATFNLSGTGALDISNAVLMIGRSDTNTVTGTTNVFSQTGGTALVGTLTMGTPAADAANNVGVSSTLSLTGGTFSATNFTLNAASGGTTSAITIGGTAQVTLPIFPTARGALGAQIRTAGMGTSTATITFDSTPGGGGFLAPTAASPVFMPDGSFTHAYLTANGVNFNVVSGKDITVAQVLENNPGAAGTLTKSGVGALTLSGSNAYTGTTTLSGGALALGSSGAIGSTGNIVFSGGTLQYSASNTTDYSSRISSGTSTGAVSIDTNGQNVTFSSSLSSSQSGGLTKAGAGTLTLSGTNTYTGATTISAGTLKLGNSSALSGGNLNVSAGALDLAGFNAATTQLSGSGAITNSTVVDSTLTINLAAGIAAGFSETITTPSTGKVNLVFNTTAGGNSSNDGHDQHAGCWDQHLAGRWLQCSHSQ